MKEYTRECYNWSGKLLPKMLPDLNAQIESGKRFQEETTLINKQLHLRWSHNEPLGTLDSKHSRPSQVDKFEFILIELDFFGFASFERKEIEMPLLDFLI